ncbi:MAG TPA: LytR C-terminal domain-containing protein [Candidatus Saccharimonadales bacterium]|nr:LytR C-terminal domain-containing protein [Candidatus Saccharimonadales bacterium]
MSDLQFAKIVASPNEQSWAQVYSAGKLFAVIALHKNGEEQTSLNVIGKDILTTLEQEFFTLEHKSLDTIKQAVSQTAKKIPDSVSSTFIVSYIADNLMYLFIKGNARALLKRDEKLGRVSDEEESDELATYSGFLQDNDTIILGTKQFFDNVAKATLLSSLKHTDPSDISEDLAPIIQGKEEPEAAAIVILYKDAIKQMGSSDSLETTQEAPEEREETEHEDKVEQPAVVPFVEIEERKSSRIPSLPFRVSLPKLPLSKTKKMILTVSVILIVLLIFAMYLSAKKQDTTREQMLYDSIYPKAQKQYEQGVSLLDLNKGLAVDSLTASQKILTDNQNKFPQGSNQRKQVDDLLQKVNDALKQNSAGSAANLDKSKITITVQNGSGQEGAAGKAADFLKSQGYNVSSTGNADNSSYTGVTIKVKNANNNFADALKKDLSQKYSVSSVTTDLSSSFATDALVIIGK